jgi:hypothetical protein
MEAKQRSMNAMNQVEFEVSMKWNLKVVVIVAACP